MTDETFFDRAIKRAEISEKAALVKELNRRREKGEAEYGASAPWHRKAPEELNAEACEECVDAPNWWEFFARSCHFPGEFLPEDAELLENAAVEAVAHVLRAGEVGRHMIVELLEECRERKRAHDEKVTPPPEPVTCLDTP
jgi:hypothetical protein